MAENDNSAPFCGNCHSTDKELKKCGNCRTTSYCSRDCQKADWKVHKKVCATQANSPSDRFNTATSSTAKPFTRLHEGTWLHDRADKEVYELLVDTYRLRMADDYLLEGRKPADSLYGGAADGLGGFRSFLDLAQSKDRLLPQWWNIEKRGECETLGMQTTGWSNLRTKATKADINSHYNDPQFAMQLRLLERWFMDVGQVDNLVHLSFGK